MKNFAGWPTLNFGLNDSEFGFIRGINSTPPFSYQTETIAFMNVISIPQDNTVYYSGTNWQITGTEMWDALDEFIVDTKGFGIWTKLKAVYPFMGGTATRHKYNLIDPQDLDSAFRLVFNGTFAHSATGAFPSYGTSAYADTKYSAAANLTAGSSHISFYSGSDGQTGTDQIDIGVQNNTNAATLAISTRYNASGVVNKTTARNGANTGTNLSVDNFYARGFYLTSRVSSANALYRNGTSVSTGTSSSSLPSGNIYICAFNNNGSPGLYSNREVRFVTIGEGLTSTESGQLSTLVETFQQALFRGTNNTLHFYGDSFTGGYYSSIDDSNRYATLVGLDFNYPITTYLAVSGQSLTQNCTASSNFDMTKIPQKTALDKHLMFCWSMFNEMGVTVTSGKPGVPFTNTTANMAQDLTAILNYANSSRGWSFSDMLWVSDFYVPNTGTSGPSNPTQADLYPFADAAINAATTLGVTVISHRSYMASNGGSSLMVSSTNEHPNLSAQTVIAQNIINNI